MLTALILVCSLAATPDLSSCTRANAIDIVRVPDQFGNPASCFMRGQAYLADTSVGRDLTGDERLKVVCSPSTRVDVTHVRPVISQ